MQWKYNFQIPQEVFSPPHTVCAGARQDVMDLSSHIHHWFSETALTLSSQRAGTEKDPRLKSFGLFGKIYSCDRVQMTHLHLCHCRAPCPGTAILWAGCAIISDAVSGRQSGPLNISWLFSPQTLPHFSWPGDSSCSFNWTLHVFFTL